MVGTPTRAGTCEPMHWVERGLRRLMDVPLRLRLLRRPAQRRQVDPDQRAGGHKVAIASSKPQTTRHAIRGIVHRPDAQLVLIDTPGLHKPRTLLGERLNDLVRATWSEVDVVGVCLPANERIGPGDTYLVGEIAKLPKSADWWPSPPSPIWRRRRGWPST